MKSYRAITFVLPALLWMMAQGVAATTPGKTEVKFGKKTKQTVGRVTNLSAGDRACYVSFTSDRGTEHHEMAGFDICELEIQGQRVKFKYARIQVIAPSCGGNPDCKRLVTEPLIYSASVIDPTLAPAKP